MSAYKSRNIPLTELYSNLQLEFIAYYVRSKVYCKDFSENYHSICLQKKAKIDNISMRNSLPSIFTSEKTKERYIKRFLGDSGFPNFTYRDEVIREKMQKWDRYYYFSVGSSISFNAYGDILVGVIEKNDKNSCIVNVKDEFNEHHVLHYDNIKKIFPDNFFDFNNL